MSGYKDTDRYRQLRKLQKRRYRNRTGSCLYPRKRWSEDEDKLVLAHEVRDVELSAMLERSVQAIQVRRCRLKEGA